MDLKTLRSIPAEPRPVTGPPTPETPPTVTAPGPSGPAARVYTMFQELAGGDR